MNDFGSYLKEQAAKELPDETLDEAKRRAQATKRSVNWNGHFVYPSGAMFAYNH